MGVLDKLKGIKVPQQAVGPVWQGPCSDGPQGGITQGLLSRWFCCRERFRILTMEGLKPSEGFNHRLEFGSMWHVCEEALAKEDTGSGITQWGPELAKYAQKLCRQHPLQQQEVDKWYQVCRLQFPLYVKHWSQHPDVTDRTPLLSEQVFHVPYTLPSGRVVYLRGKWDSVDRVGNGLWLQENKSKGDIRQDQITRQLTFDLQTLMYLVALDRAQELDQFELVPNSQVLGVRYNVIRRPLSGGKGTIVQKAATKGSKCPKCKGGEIPLGANCPKCRGAKRIGAKLGETKDAYYQRLARYIEAEPAEYFMRWQVRVTPADVQRFKRECLDPVLENLCDDYEWWEAVAESRTAAGKNAVTPWMGDVRHKRFPHHFPRHYREPFGVYDPIREGGSTDLDEYIATGNAAGLHRVADLFPELKEG